MHPTSCSEIRIQSRWYYCAGRRDFVTGGDVDGRNVTQNSEFRLGHKICSSVVGNLVGKQLFYVKTGDSRTMLYRTGFDGADGGHYGKMRTGHDPIS